MVSDEGSCDDDLSEKAYQSESTLSSNSRAVLSINDTPSDRCGSCVLRACRPLTRQMIITTTWVENFSFLYRFTTLRRK